MTWTSFDTSIAITAALAGAACAVPGTFLVLRKMSMMGDAISHAVLPGLALGFLLTGSRAGLPMFVGAALLAVLTAVLTEAIHERGRVDEGASMGVVFTVLFAVGLILLVRGANAVDLDPGCVLYGAIELTPLLEVSIAGLVMPQATFVLGVVLVVNLLVTILFFKELNLSSFDPGLATTLGIDARVFHYLVMSMTAITTVAAFESVGSIIVIAMLIVPAATAGLFTRRLVTMLVAAVALALASGVAGHWAAITVPTWFGFEDTITAGGIAVVLGGLFVVALIIAPGQGLVARLLHGPRVRFGILVDDLLASLYRSEEGGAARAGYVEIGEGMRRAKSSRLVWLGLLSLAAAGKVELSAVGARLTDKGREEARAVIASHRLWEGYLAERTVLSAAEVHSRAHQLEHVTDSALREELNRASGASTDPHGKPIPS